MPEKTPCVHCKKVGFVRSEHVIRAGKSVIEFYCGSCDHSWTVKDGDSRAKRHVVRRSGTKPDRSRS